MKFSLGNILTQAFLIAVIIFIFLDEDCRKSTWERIKNLFFKLVNFVKGWFKK
jgi:hypothetical protein